MAAEMNVVNFNKKTGNDAITQQVNAKRIFERVEELILNLLQAATQRMFENADDTLFKMVEKAGQTEDQTLYFDSMRIIRLQRDTITKAFIESIKKKFDGVLARKASKALSADSDTEFSMDTLSLMDEDALEVSIAIKNMISKMQYQYTEELGALNQRLNHLLPDAKFDDTTNPMGPEVICQTFHDTTKNLNLGVKINLIILKLFEQHISNGLKPLYDTSNQLLVDAGILPRIKHGGTKSAAGSDAGKPTSESKESGKVNQAQSAAPAQTSYLQNLMNLYRQTGSVEQAFAGGFGPLPISDENFIRSTRTLSSILTLLQNVHIDSDSSEPHSSLPEGGLRQYVMSHMQEQGHDPKIIHPIDNDIIDIVSMLFEYILDDETFPDTAKAVLAKLQIPMLKAAVLDKEFFATKGHPARTLLNEMARATMAITESDSEQATAFLEKIRYIVDTVINEFRDDIRIFDSLLKEFQQFMQLSSQKELRVQKKIADYMQHKEDHALAGKWVEESLVETLAKHQLPPTIEALITGPWREVMIRTYLNSGQESDAWKNQVRFIEILDWSIQPKRVSVDRSKLAGIIYQLIKTFRNGLTTVGMDNEQISHFLLQMEPYHVASIKGQRHIDSAQDLSLYASKVNQGDVENQTNMSVEEISDAIKQIEVEIASLESTNQTFVVAEEEVIENVKEENTFFESDKAIMEDIVLAGWDSRDHDPAEQPQDDYLEMARHLDQGKWVEFTKDDGRKVRAKLAYKSDLLGEYTFLDWKYKLVADKTLYSLAADLRRGSAMIIDDVPVLDRALNAVMNTLSGGKR